MNYLLISIIIIIRYNPIIVSPSLLLLNIMSNKSSYDCLPAKKHRSLCHNKVCAICQGDLLLKQPNIFNLFLIVFFRKKLKDQTNSPAVESTAVKKNLRIGQLKEENTTCFTAI